MPTIIDTQNIKSAGAGVPVITTCYSLQDAIDAGYVNGTKAYTLAEQMLSYSSKRVAKYYIASVSTRSSVAPTRAPLRVRPTPTGAPSGSASGGIDACRCQTLYNARPF